MASIALSVIGCIDYLAYGNIFTRAMFCPKKKLMFFFPPEKPEMSPGGWCIFLHLILHHLFGKVASTSGYHDAAVTLITRRLW